MLLVVAIISELLVADGRFTDFFPNTVLKKRIIIRCCFVLQLASSDDFDLIMEEFFNNDSSILIYKFQIMLKDEAIWELTKEVEDLKKKLSGIRNILEDQR
mmetsp:Transcript_32451/g.37792  ORF Transcript_32451/g.37792 Transcript_32451/m.37792 type:complete len:101 (-) Transcript_32451:974-1276(-)